MRLLAIAFLLFASTSYPGDGLARSVPLQPVLGEIQCGPPANGKRSGYKKLIRGFVGERTMVFLYESNWTSEGSYQTGSVNLYGYISKNGKIYLNGTDRNLLTGVSGDHKFSGKTSDRTFFAHTSLIRLSGPKNTGGWKRECTISITKDKAIQQLEARSDLQIEIVKLNKTIEGLQLEYDELQTEHQEASGKITMLEDTRSELQINIAKLRNEIQSLRDDYTELTQAKAQDESGLQEAEKDNQVLIDELSVARQLGRELQIKLSLESDENSKLARNHDELVEKNVNLNADIARLETLKDQLAMAQMKHKEDIARLFEDKRSLQQQLAEQAVLKQTLQQEIVAVAQVRDQLEVANQSLAQDKRSLEGRATSLSEDKDQLREENKELRRWIPTLAEFEQSRQQLEDERTKLMAERRLFKQNAARLSEDKASLTGQLIAVGDQYKLTKVELETLRAKHADEVAAFKQERDLLKEDLEALEILKARNTKLEFEYNRLIKPARSKVGRVVVRVRYWKDATGDHYSLGEPGQKQTTEVTRSELHRRLAELKQKHGSKLYTAIWFPDGTSLSHAESASFTSLIHNRYDYYYSKN